MLLLDNPNLFFAITKKNLYISNAYTRMLFGSTTRNSPSRFLNEVPKELCEVKSVRGGMSNFGFGSAGAIVMTIMVLILSSVYIKRALS